MSAMLLDRTFHPDEANQAFTTGRLLETGRYEYQPDDHHGPTLYYAAAALQKAAGHDTLATMDGSLLRCTPLLFAVLTLVFGFLAVRRLARSWLVPSLFVILLGTSPIFIFFATNFIQEMLLSCFTMMMFWAGVGYMFPGKRWKPGTWALLFGIAAGLAFATKETSVLAFAAAGLAGIPLAWRFRKDMRFEPRDAVLALAGFALTAILFFSSFASNWQGVYNAFVAAPLSYLGRAAGSAASAGAADHVHPWWQYLKWLFAEKNQFHPIVISGLLLGLAGWCMPRIREAFPLKKTFLFLILFSLILSAVYAVIPYKTPWCALQMFIPLLLTAFLGTLGYCRASYDEALRRLPSWAPTLVRVISFCPVALLVTLQLVCDAKSLERIYRDPDSKDIPYNYASASPEVKQLAATVADAMSRSREGTSAFIAVALPPADTWPFPWYNRPYEPQTGYWTSFDDLKQLAVAGTKPTVVIVPMTEGHLVQPLFPHLKNTKRFHMRPGVRVRVFW